jgi:hypothetical protein
VLIVSPDSQSIYGGQERRAAGEREREGGRAPTSSKIIEFSSALCGLDICMCIGESLSLCHVHPEWGFALLYRKPHLDAIDCRQIGSSLVRAKDRERERERERARAHCFCSQPAETLENAANICTYTTSAPTAAAAFGHLHSAVAGTPERSSAAGTSFSGQTLVCSARIMELELCERVNN